MQNATKALTNKLRSLLKTETRIKSRLSLSMSCS